MSNQNTPAIGHKASLRRRAVLIILDGFGSNPAKTNNAVALANTPNLDCWFRTYPHTTIEASGQAVGLPQGQMGNSEVGHMTLGSGSVVLQDLVLINEAIEDGRFFGNPALNHAMDRAAHAGRPVHLLGLVSDGGVHSHLNHLLALIRLAERHGARPLVHMITDGRDTPPKSALRYLPALEEALALAGGAVASVHGRYWTMDRDHRWDRTELAWKALAAGEGRRTGTAREAIESAYASDRNDEFIEPVLLPDMETFRDGDQVISFNFRKDRPRQIIEALVKDDFTGFARPARPRVDATCMMEYHPDYKLRAAFRADKPQLPLNQYLAAHGLTQFHCAETEKYPHVTYYFNGGAHDKAAGETHVMLPSPKVSTYDLMPEMSAPQVADALVRALESGEYDFLVVNFANGDMVGHTGVREAAVRAVEALDREVDRVIQAAHERGYAVVLTADHGNCDEMVDPGTGEPHTQHTTHPVPLLVVDRDARPMAPGGGLADVAPTILQLMGLPRPEPMKGRSLLVRPEEEEMAA